MNRGPCTVYPKKYAHGFCFAVLCCGYTLTDFPISIRLTSLALRQSNDCPSASKATLMNVDKYFMWIHYERLHNHNKAKHNKTVCIFLGIYCTTYLLAIASCCWVQYNLIVSRGSGMALIMCQTGPVPGNPASIRCGIRILPVVYSVLVCKGKWWPGLGWNLLPLLSQRVRDDRVCLA